MKINDKSYILAVLFMVFGILLSVQFRSVLNSKKNKPSVAYQIENLQNEIKTEKLIGSKLREEIDENIKKQDEYIKMFMEGRNDNELAREWESVKLAAGLTDVMGNGVIVHLADASEQLGRNIDNYVVHDVEIVEVLNELKKAGAQAISVNNERIISTSEIICAGPTVRINRTRYPVPYEIKAIGDPKKLYDALVNSPIASEFLMFDKKFEVRIAKDIVIPKYGGDINNLVDGLEVIE
ncbi:MAG TPA: DUF881 domain-containing protein [Acetivibrio sp.]|uniref:DUF881 domain-containing protein n=1 Tax=Acetivibrio sp. TaxID=1872092 RepID=UPI002C889118|nr:DUF881 domain-containing protein [Acetivibrio sp.]HOM01434.1 DUF881 domain-containing protein [Acetivibrio sp.]